MANLTEHILLRKENDLLNSLIGQSFNQKNKFEAEKILDEIHSKAESRMIGKKALCYIVDKNEILGVGGSTMMKDKNGKIISNLILDQFGKWLAGIYLITSTAQAGIIIKDRAGVNKTVLTRQNGANLFLNTGLGALGMSLQVGSGSTAPARTDFDIETAFGTLPESTLFVLASNAVFNSGLGNFKYVGAVSAGGSGTINESISQAGWRDFTGGTFFFTIFRDIISPSVPFIVGQTIALEYTVQL